MKKTLFAMCGLMIILLIVIFIKTRSTTLQNETLGIRSGNDIAKLSMMAIEKNDISVCNNFKILSFNVAEYSMDEVIEECTEEFNKFTADKNSSNSQFSKQWSYSPEAEFSYLLPELWSAYPDINYPGCLMLFKPYPVSKEEKTFSKICVIKVNNIEDYLKTLSTFDRIRDTETFDISVKIVDYPSGDKKYIFTKMNKTFEIHYFYKKLTYSDFDEKNIFKIIGHISTKL